MRKLSKNSEAVSPVIATILMVAVTVVIAAVVYTYVGGMGSSKESAPTVSLSAEGKSGDTLTLTHDGGDELQWSDLKVLIDGTEIASGDYGTGAFTVGEEFDVKDDGSAGTSYVIKIIHKPSNAVLLDKEVYLA